MIPEQIILASLKELSSQNIRDIRNNLDRIISCHIDVVNSIYEAKVKLEPREVYIETLIIKIILASKSVLDLSEGSTLKGHKSKIKREIVDLASINILTRAIIENFLTLEYLNFNNLTKDERIFRYKLWEISGFISRQSFKIRVLTELNKKLESEKRKIEKY